ncbi:MAG: Uma2 family endonuclease, partial [Dolichospermum sp.]|nr:Uma2 family endonuclease [Dolichospermum sp.]
MIQTLSKVTTFEEFVAGLPDNSGVRYELHNGNIIEMAQ